MLDTYQIRGLLEVIALLLFLVLAIRFVIKGVRGKKAKQRREGEQLITQIGELNNKFTQFEKQEGGVYNEFHK